MLKISQNSPIFIATDKNSNTLTTKHQWEVFRKCCFANEYALWRTESLNLSIRQDPSGKSGQLRHLGFEDPTAGSFTKTTDVNGIVWENFNAQQQADEINAIWPDAEYLANHPKGG